MFKLKKDREQTGLEKAIEDVLFAMDTTDPTDPAYAKMVKQLTKLHKMKEEERPSRVSKDAVLTAAANLAGIVVIVGYEQKHILTSKALPFLGKLR